MKNNKSQFLNTREEIVEWLDKNYINNYTINNDLSVDVNEHVNISHKNLKVIPVKFRKVANSFNCSGNQLTNLIGSPKTVGGNFWCYNNQLTNLTGAPKTVGGGHFNCNGNRLISLVGSPRSIYGSFWCNNNKLTNLDGSPETVGEVFCCRDNSLTSLCEIIDCDFKNIAFNIDTEKFTSKELIQILKKYYNLELKHYELTRYQFHDIVKPFLEKKVLQKSLNNSEINTKSKNIFI